MRTSTEQMLLSYKKILDVPALLDGNIIINAPTNEDYEKSKAKKPMKINWNLIKHTMKIIK